MCLGLRVRFSRRCFSKKLIKVFNFISKGSRPFSAENISKISHTELLKKREETYQKEIEREKMEKEKYQRKIEEMEKKLSDLTPNASSPFQVN